ncbi:MAG: SpoIIE family protein phosphatase [Pseudomonadota bacterium]|jgi:serine phosphatase RsbU (regulator of sigma subunit)|nr:SpoIIE family protein phosphatase [Pseudomonadota bacterium]
MELRIAVSKINKSRDTKSGDTVEVVERPNGGMSVVLADGQIDGSDNKSISTMVTHRVIGHISDGIHDGAAIRTSATSIYNEFEGKVSSNLNVISADLQTNTIIISRNTPIPVFLISDETVDSLAAESEPIGQRIDIKPTIVELQIQPEMAVIAFSDGVCHAGRQNQQIPDITAMIEALVEEQELYAQEIADFLLNRAIRMDEGRPKDDMSVVVMSILPITTDKIRRLNVTMTLDE